MRNPFLTLIISLVLALAPTLQPTASAQSASAPPTSPESKRTDTQPDHASADPSLEAPPVLDVTTQAQSTDKSAPGDNTKTDGQQDDSDSDSHWSFRHMLWTVWNAELFSASGSPIQLNQIVIALLIILIGLWVSKRLARLVRFRVARIQRINPHAAGVIQTVVFNTLAVLIVLAAMPIAGIPTTIFTVIGGAVAIGIDFGAQNLFNNLISGLIIMLERPIRLGDIIQVGEQEGVVESINNRCTTLRRPDGIDLLVPNSQFLEQPVVNWTLTDRDVRGNVVVGVAYGSPTDTVAQLLSQCMEEHTLIHERPAPIVLFQDFGDNALIFHAYFWSQIRRPMDLKKIQSDIRFRFDELCRDAGIVIAFPQRDVHLDTIRPVEIKIVSDNQDKP